MTGWTKSVRALFAALFTTLLALLMHLGAGGGVSIPGTAVVFVLVLWAAMIVAGRRLGYLTLAGLLGLGQVLMHLTMSWSSHTFAHAGAHAGTAQSGSGQAGAAGTGSTSAEAALHTHAGHIVPASGSLDLGPATTALGQASHGATSVGMIIAHAVAVLVTAVILKRGEDIVLSILQLALGPVIGALRALAEAAGVLADEPFRKLCASFRVPQPVTSAVVGPNYRRGPPALV
ncbi:hypothetical protein BI49514_02271 [Brevibacterium iodinum ATCC 49514]|uniref:Uncharacterized protein n=1 Tax=Brevibacterium iodinum ATCC 49514 TaxID=1255616 RepID=A0A2H1JR61_9MICO|nr:hypothetical protein [Brevibacterium iodinum]SMX89980.1 hypothetical protein BI49514_02271 [Brevibacterium iodinum ATCC 49514]SUW13914.1 Uncharacterised protein [Brevibacterium iodinum]